MTNTLGLDDGLDSVELVQDVEAAFGVQFTDKEAEACFNVGDIYGVLSGRFSGAQEGAGRCATAMTFYRLRRAFASLNIDAQTIRLDTQVKSLTHLNSKALLRQINASSGLRLPQPRLTGMGVAGVCSIFVGILSVLGLKALGPYWWPVPALLMAAGIILIRFDPNEIPSDCQTVGGLSRKVAGLNFAKLIAAGAQTRDGDLWNALAEVLSEHTSLPKSEIRPETLLLQSQLRAA